MLYRDVLEYKTKTQDKRDITKDVQGLVDKYGVKEGLCNIFVQSTTAGLMINEDDRMLVADIDKMLDRIAPRDKLYQHPENAHSHIKAAIFKNNLNIPVADGKLLLGTWQSIMLWEFDVKERQRTVVVTIIAG